MDEENGERYWADGKGQSLLNITERAASRGVGTTGPMERGEHMDGRKEKGEHCWIGGKRLILQGGWKGASTIRRIESRGKYHWTSEEEGGNWIDEDKRKEKRASITGRMEKDEDYWMGSKSGGGHHWADGRERAPLDGYQ